MASFKDKTTDYLHSSVKSNLPARIQIRHSRIPVDTLTQDFVTLNLSKYIHGSSYVFDKRLYFCVYISSSFYGIAHGVADTI
jgi:hypothetical protein